MADNSPLMSGMSEDLKSVLQGVDGSIEGKIHSKTLRALLVTALTPGPNQLQAQALYWKINESVKVTFNLSEGTKALFIAMCKITFRYVDEDKRCECANHIRLIRADIVAAFENLDGDLSGDPEVCKFLERLESCFFDSEEDKRRAGEILEVAHSKLHTRDIQREKHTPSNS